MPTILVTGGAGFIGSHVADALLDAGHDVVVVDNLSTGQQQLAPPAATFHQVDVLDETLVDLMAATRPEVVCHLAAQVNVRVSVDNPLLDVQQNVLGTLNVVECARRAGVSKFVFSSSGGAIYGTPTEDPVTEAHPARPLSPYGTSKLAAEQFLRMYHDLYGIAVVSLRYANVYGPRQNPEGEAGVVALFCRKLTAGEAPVIFGDGEQTRDFVYVTDVARANVAAVDKLLSAPAGEPPCLALNIGTGRHASVNELARRLAEHLHCDVAPVHTPEKLGEVRSLSLSAEAAAEHLSWRPTVALEEGLRRTAEYFAGATKGSLPR